MTTTAAATTYPWLDAITLDESDPSGRVVVSTPDGPVARVPAPVAALVRAAQHDEPAADPELVAAALRALDALPAVSAARRPEHDRPRRVQLRKPFSVQLTLVDPMRLAGPVGRLRPVLQARATWWALATATGLALVTAVALAVVPGSPLHGTLTVGGYLGVLLALVGGVFVHELAHALVLVAFGGRSRRVGVMLFYLAPAFFCDASDAWRLPPARRAQVALAGVLAQGTLAALAFAAMPFVGADLRSGLALFGFVNAGWGMLNLVPFIKLDGYVALAGYLDEPDLRAHCMAEARAVLAGRGAARDARRVLYGIACIAFPVLVVLSAVLALGTVLAPLGRAGSWAALVAVGALAAWGVARLVGHVRRVRRRVPGPAGRTSDERAGRTSVRTAAVSAALVLGVALVPLPVQAVGGYVELADGPALALTSRDRAVPPGTRVTVREQGLVPGPVRGTARVVGAPVACEIPLAAAVPVHGDEDLTLDGWCLPLDGAVAGPARGAATADLGRRGLAVQVAQLVAGVWR